MDFLPIEMTLNDNQKFRANPLCRDTLDMTIEFYKKVGFVPPWIGYYVEEKGELVGCAAFKGPPINGTVEIAYGTFEEHRKKGIGTTICKRLVDLSLKTDPSIKITARTLPEENFSNRILKKNNFSFLGTVIDMEDGEVWEWAYTPGAEIK